MGKAICWAVLIMCLLSANAFAQNYLGEYCIQLHTTEDQNGPNDRGSNISRIGVTQMGGNYFTVQGVFLPTNDSPAVSNGSAVLVGSELVMTIAASQEHTTSPNQDRSTLHMTLSVSNFTGTFWTLGSSFNTSTRIFSSFYRAGTAAVVPCP